MMLIFWLTGKDEIAQAISNAIFEYLGVDKVDILESSIDKIIAKGIDIDRQFWLTACGTCKCFESCL